MHREMRRKDRQATAEETMEIIENGLYGVLATADKNNMPYGVPLSYNYTNGAIYFHGAKVGHKVDNINDNNNVCFNYLDIWIFRYLILNIFLKNENGFMCIKFNLEFSVMTTWKNYFNLIY